MTDNEFMLFDRLTKIRATIEKYGEENFYLSFSGGKDSTVLHELLDLAIPGNTIPRVYANTGIELNLVRQFVQDKAEQDQRIVIIKPEKAIVPMLKEKGYPFKSKEHSFYLETYQRNKAYTKTVNRYLYPSEERKSFGCPQILRYQFTPDFDLKVSDKCCNELKKKPLKQWQKENNKPYSIVGLRQAEGGQRNNTKCLAFNGNKLKAFHPLAIVGDDFIEWFIEEHNVELSAVYYPPYNFKRTGCKGCPFALHLQEELDTLQEFFPNERKQCENIWQPVYDEYRRINYRLKDGGQLKWF